MTDEPSETRKSLIRALMGLPSLEECEAVIRAGGLPIDQRSREIFYDRILEIKIGYPLWDTIRRRPEWAEAIIEIDHTLNDLLQKLQTDTARRALEIIEEGALLPPFKDTLRLVNDITEFRGKVHNYRQIYSANKPRRTTPQNWLFEKFYRLYEEISGIPPAIHGPLLYRFTIAGAKALDIEVNIDEDAFRVRLDRHLKKRNESDLTDPEFRMLIQHALNGYYTRS
jgi:hypothetical protein